MGLHGLVIVLQSLLKYGGLWTSVSPDIVDSNFGYDLLNGSGNNGVGSGSGSNGEKNGGSSGANNNTTNSNINELNQLTLLRAVEGLKNKENNQNNGQNNSQNNQNIHNSTSNSNNSNNNNNTNHQNGNNGNNTNNELRCDINDNDENKSDSDQTNSGTVEIGKGSIVDNFDRKQKAQEEIETGILKFNQSSKKGIAFLVDRGHVEMTPKGVAMFLRQYSEKLDKTSVGEYLGREREYEGGFCLKVLHEFVDSMDFSGMAFDLAIRYFLAGFRLPGEAQKIDRLMEKFAERYYLQNKDTFASADMAFILAFSTSKSIFIL